MSRGASFVSVDAWRNDEEKVRMEMWALTERTLMHADDWRRFFAEAGYRGDYTWFIP